MTDRIQQTIVFVMGMSGSGKKTAMAALEDCGYYCIDNLPLTLIESTIGECQRLYNKIAFCIDIRGKAWFNSGIKMISDLRQNENIACHVIFLDADNEILIKRFSETRRKHPENLLQLSPEPSSNSLHDDLCSERATLSVFHEVVTCSIDTSTTNVHDLKHEIKTLYGDGKTGMHIRVLSFGYKHGVPKEAHLTIDVRFIENPFFNKEMRTKTGKDAMVYDFVMGQKETIEFLSLFLPLITYLIPKYEAELKDVLTIAIGCTGGQHRSISIARYLEAYLTEHFPYPVSISHRDFESRIKD